MNAVERLEAAITKLAELRQYSLIKPPLSVHEGPEWFELRDAQAEQVAPYMSGFDAELLATLHRTIDAQLAILRADLAFIESESGPLHEFEPSAAVVALADAIVGRDQ